MHHMWQWERCSTFSPWKIYLSAVKSSSCVWFCTVIRQHISAPVWSVPISLCSASLPYMAVTESDYVAHSIISLRYTICLFLNKLHTLTGRSGLGMQAVSVSITALLFCAATWLPGLYPFSGRNSLPFVSVIVSLLSRPSPLLFLTSFLPPFLSHSVHKVMSRWRNPQMITAHALEEGIQKYVCRGREGICGMF